MKQLFFYKPAQKWYTNVHIDEKTTFYPFNVAKFTTGTQGDLATLRFVTKIPFRFLSVISH